MLDTPKQWSVADIKKEWNKSGYAHCYEGLNTESSRFLAIFM